MCFPHSCRYPNLLIGNNKELLQKLDAFRFNYQHLDCLYLFFKNRFRVKFVVKSGQLFDNLQRAVLFKQQNRGADRMSSVAKKRLLRNKYSCSAPSKTLNRRRLVDQSLQTELNKLEG